MIESMTTLASPSKIKNKKLKFIVEKREAGCEYEIRWERFPMEDQN